MPKYKVTWWESNRWQTIIEAESEEDAIDKTMDMTEEAFDNAKETDDSFIESGDYEAKLYLEEEEKKEEE